MARVFLTFVLLSLVCFSKAQDTLCYLDDINRFPRERFVDFEQMNLNINFLPDSGKINGNVTHTFKVLRTSIDSLYLDGVNMSIKKIYHQGKEAAYEVSPKGITIRFKKPLKINEISTVSIDYSAHPKKGMYFIGWDDSTGRSRKQIWTQGQGVDNRHWVPLFDDMSEKITTTIAIEFNEEYSVLSNGILANTKSDKEGNKTWIYEMKKPHSPYLIMIGIGEYAINNERSTSGVLLNQYYYPEFKERLEPTYRYSKQIFDFLETEIGMPYPYVKYAQIPVQDFPYGAMENTTATVFGDFFLVDSLSFNDRNYVYVNGHELAHQWFGDLLTSRSPAHHWLHESFATYYHCLVSGEVFGDNEFRKMMFDNQTAALAAGKLDYKGVGHSQANSSRHYQKGSYVLKMLRYLVGEEEFKAGILKFLKDHKYQSVTTQNLIDAFHDTTGQEIGWFVDQWVSKGGEPHLKVDFKQNKKTKTYDFYIEQLQDTTPLTSIFKMPVWIEIYFESGDSIRRQFWLKNHYDTFKIKSTPKASISYIVFDPNQEILKQILFKRPTKWLINQAMFGNNMIDRYDALIELRKASIKNKEEALRIIFEKEDYYLPKSEALNQLIAANVSVENEIKSMVESKDTQLQRAVLYSWSSIDKKYEHLLIKLFKAQSYDVVQLALYRAVKNFPNNTDFYLKQTDGIKGTAGLNVRIQWLELKTLQLKNKAALDELVDYTSNSFGFLTRKNAMNALKRLAYCDKKLVRNLALGIQKSNWKLSKNCGLLLRYFYNNVYTELISSTVDTLILSDEQRLKVKKFMTQLN